MFNEQSAYTFRRPHDPFQGLIAQIRSALAIKRIDHTNALGCADRLTGRARDLALANAMRLKREAAELAMDLAMLLGGR